ncbi:Uma2 family endonuclease [Streptomyces sp. NPDC058067]|uniref:Uma2 family endonuclease n=1 Tax=Streptomyces sp. NPDC058067 TaxID=3346324 RepID=UPI0036E6E7BC
MGETLTTDPPETAPEYHWPVPPQDGYTVDDLFTLPNLPPHTELLDGSLVFASPQRLFHSLVTDLLVGGLRSTVPPELKVRRDMTVVLDSRNGLEPDISVVPAERTGTDVTHYQAADVRLAVEVVSPDTEARDHDTKPHKYAAAGIPNFWLAEMAGADSHPVVRVYELDPVSKTYALTGIHHGQLKASVPYLIDVDITTEALNQL